MAATENFALPLPQMGEPADIRVLNRGTEEIDGIMNGNRTMFAPAWVDTETYHVGSRVVYLGEYYVCKADNVTGAWDATKWDHKTVGEDIEESTGGASALADLDDVEITSPTDGQALVYDDTDDVWKNATLPEPVDVEANPSASATANLSKLKVGSTVYGVSGLPSTSSASNGDVLTLGSGKTPTWAAPAVGGDGVTIDTSTVITSGNIAEYGALNYTATQDCFVAFSVNPKSGYTTYIKINNVTIKSFYGNFGNSDGLPYEDCIFLKTGQTLYVNNNANYTGSYHVYGVQEINSAVVAQLNAMKTGFDGVVYSSPAAMVQGEDQKLQDQIAVLDMFDSSTVTNNKSMLYSNGSVVTLNGCFVSDFMPVIPGAKVKITLNLGSSSYANVFFAEDKSTVTGKYYSNSDNSFLTVPDGSKYLRVTGGMSRISEMRVITAVTVDYIYQMSDDLAYSKDISQDTEPWVKKPYTNIEYGHESASWVRDVSAAMVEYSLSDSGIGLSANHTYLAYYEIELGSSIGVWPAATAFYPFLRNNTAYSNISLTNVKTANMGTYNVGDKYVIYGYYTPSADMASVSGRMVTYNGGTSTRKADWIFNKVYIVDVTDLSSYDDLLNTLDNITGNQMNFGDSKLQQMENTIDEVVTNFDYDADLICWGDSLTAGAGGDGTNYPAVCANELGLSYKNCGVGGENCQTIAARQGGNSVVIPAGSVNGTYSTLYDVIGNEIAPLLQGNGSGSGNSLIINGETCSLSYSSGTGYTISGYSGAATTIPLLARFAGNDFKGKIVTIWIGTNGGSFPGTSTGIETRIAWIKSMIAHIGHDRYVVLGLTVGEETASFYINEENMMKQAFGNKYFPTRKYLIESGLTINGITPTEQDEADISAGKVPTSLKSDSIHLNAYGYTAVGKLLANKIRSLGYVD